MTERAPTPVDRPTAADPTPPVALDAIGLDRDTVYRFPEGDWYWNRYREAGTYEVEIDRVLRRAADRPYGFVDAGANFGYWSVLVSSHRYGGHAAVAVEASRPNFEVLAANALANGHRFRLRHNAVLDRSGQEVRLHGEKHYGRSLHPTWHPEDAPTVERVTTVTIDEVAAADLPATGHPPIVKLDVEGVEIEAMAGAARVVEEGALVVFECHGKDAGHRTSAHVLSLDGMAVWRADPGGPRRITDLDQVAAIKQDPTKGYNFFTTRSSSPWVSLFES